MIIYFLSNTSAKNYRNRIVYVKIIESQRWDVCLKHGVFTSMSTRESLQLSNIKLFSLAGIFVTL